MIAIAAVAANGTIGLNGKLPWHLPEDLRFFKQTTLGQIVLMGRNTFDSLPRPLPNRENWVVTSRPLSHSNVRTFSSPAEVPLYSPDHRNIYLIGGAKLYQALLPACSELLLTYIYREFPGDTFLPPIPPTFTLHSILLRHPTFEIRRYLNSSPTSLAPTQ